MVQPQVTVGGATRAHVGGNFTITADAVTFSATGTNNAMADTISVGIEGVGISVTEHPAKTEHTSEAFVPANANLTINGGSLSLTATSNNTADAGETGVDVAGLNVAVMTAAAETAGLTRACVEEGVSVTATGLTLAATATNNANAEINLVGIGAITVGVTTARARNSDTVTVCVEGDSDLDLSGSASLTATSTNTASADAGNVQVGLLAAGDSHAEATAGGEVSASLDGNLDATGSLTIQARANNTAEADNSAYGGGVISGDGAVSEATVSPDISAFIDSGANVDVNGNITVQSLSHGNADADAVGLTMGCPNRDKARHG